LSDQKNNNPETEKSDGPRVPLPEAKSRGYFEGESVTRRNAFMVSSQVLTGLAGAAVVLPTIAFALAPVLTPHEERWEAVGTLDDFTADTYRPVVFTETLGIGEVGKTTAYVRRGSSEFEGESDDEYIAISTRCAHLGCPVRFVQSAKNFICPCHGGVYDFVGKRIGGPPPRPLDRFQTRVSGDRVELGPRYSVTNQLKAVRVRDPGEFTGGIWEFLYPPRPSTPPAP
jgi:Rieske Fe-S protein